MVKNIAAPGLLMLLLGIACGEHTAPQSATPSANALGGSEPETYAQVTDNIKNDTLLIQTTFDLGDGTYVMVASNVEGSFEGLRLYHYQAQADSSGKVLAFSDPGYDSWTMLPTFFRLRAKDKGQLILANFGERESWGQKLMILKDEFKSVGFLDIAKPERVMDDDILRLKRRDIGPQTRLLEKGDTLYLTFDTDSVYLYDDLNGNLDIVLPANSVQYRIDPVSGLQLWVDGVARKADLPPA